MTEPTYSEEDLAAAEAEAEAESAEEPTTDAPDTEADEDVLSESIDPLNVNADHPDATYDQLVDGLTDEAEAEATDAGSGS